MVLCFGDSITEGRPGATYLKYVKPRKQYKNFGLGGDTLIGMTKRVARAIDDPKYSGVKTIIIGIGTNDVLHPFLKNYARSWTRIVDGLVLRGSVPCEDEAEFRERYEILLKMLKQAGKEVIIFGIPLLETDIAELNQKAVSYNEIIKELCGKFMSTYLDIMSFQREVKSRQNNKGTCFFSKNVFEPVILAILTTYLPFTDMVSKRRGLAVSVDGVHMNTVSAKGLAGLIDNAVQIR
ncbi:MAG: SGNH/GDSL hydrolase family protein [Clostridiaceae bacterium]|nr:SGNH/GDSL hydrolase family protein [Clostridiaceae bacterium]